MLCNRTKSAKCHSLDADNFTKGGLIYHTYVLYMENMMEDAIKFQFRPELTYWEEFKQKLREYEEKISSEVV